MAWSGFQNSLLRWRALDDCGRVKAQSRVQTSLCPSCLWSDVLVI